MSLKLFSHSLEQEFRRDSSPAASEVLGNLELSVRIARLLIDEEMPKTQRPFHYVSIFGRLCTAAYPGGMSVLYQNIHISILWAFLIDEKDSLGNQRIASLTNMDTITLFEYVTVLAVIDDAHALLTVISSDNFFLVQ